MIRKKCDQYVITDCHSCCYTAAG